MTGNEASQFSVSGVEDGEPNAGVDYPLATESPYIIYRLDNIDAEEEYHNGLRVRMIMIIGVCFSLRVNVNKKIVGLRGGIGTYMKQKKQQIKMMNLGTMGKKLKTMGNKLTWIS